MGISQLQGTPWHVENLKMNEEDTRRHKKWCVHNNDGFCELLDRACVGSKNCEKYEYNENYEKKSHELKDDCLSYNIDYKKYLKGRFTLEYEDGSRELYVIGSTVKCDAPIIDYILNTKLKDSFEYNGENIKVVMKKIKYRDEYNRLTNPFLRKILSSKELGVNDINITKYSHFKFKIKNIKTGEIYKFIVGENIRWDDELINYISRAQKNLKFCYKGEEIRLLSKYVVEKKRIIK